MPPHLHRNAFERSRHTSQPRRRGLFLELLETRQLMAGEALPAPVISNIVRDESAAVRTLLIRGVAAEGDSVSIYQSGRGFVGQTTPNAQGQWTFRHENASLARGKFEYVAIAQGLEGSESPASAPELFQPNLVLINLDDTRADELSYMPFVSQVLAAQGTLFTNSFVPTALSGPSRSSLLTGQYSHTHGTFNVHEPLGGSVNRDWSKALASWLQDAGYHTAFYGKTCEGYVHELESIDETEPAPGWDTYNVWLGGYYFRGGVASNGVVTRFGTAPEHYSTDVLVNMADDYLRSSPDGEKPFFLYLAPTSAHAPFTPAPRHDGMFKDLEIPNAPSYGVVPEDVPLREPFEPTATESLEFRRKHLETLLSADEGVERVFQTLQDEGELDNTVIVFTTDHGYLWGEHALSAKQSIHEEAIKVPLVVFDGRTALAGTSDELVLNIDIAPTLAALAGAPVPIPVDGVSLVDTLYTSNKHVRDEFLIENHWAYNGIGRSYVAEGLGSYSEAVRTHNWKYVEYASGHVQLFNLVNDPYEMRNLAGDENLAVLQQQLAVKLEALRSPDREGPEITALNAFWDTDAQGMPYLRVRGATSDAATGGNEVRSPEAFIDVPEFDSSGIPMDAVDGKFNAEAEQFTRKIPWLELIRLQPGTHTLYVHGRDPAGNWGSFRTVTFTMGPRPALAPSSDTGASSRDGFTVDDTPTLQGTAPANSVVELFYSFDSQNVLIHGGSTSANASGVWRKTLSLDSGSYRLITVATDPATQQRVVGLSRLIYVAAQQLGDQYHVAGTRYPDEIQIDANLSPGSITVLVRGINAGTLPAGPTVHVASLGANDSITVRGNVNTWLEGGEGDDLLVGGTGIDVLDGGIGVNHLTGGRGDDHYLFRSSTSLENGQIGIEDVVSEFAGEGDDLLDFGEIIDDVVVNFQGTRLATYDSTRPVRSSRRVLLAEPGGNAFEKVQLGTQGGVVRANTDVALTSVAGDRTIVATNGVPVGSTVAIRSFSAIANQSDQLIVLEIAVPEGTLHVRSGVAGGLSPEQITNNGTGVLQLTGSPSQINTSLHARGGLLYRATGASPGLMEIIAQQSLQAGGVVRSRQTLRLDVLPGPLQAISVLAIAEDAALQTVALSGIQGEPQQSFRIRAVTNNTGLIPNTSVDYVPGSSTGTLSLRPRPDWHGSAIIVVSVLSGGADLDLSTPADNGVFQRRFVVTVQPVNDAAPLLDNTLSPAFLSIPEDPKFNPGTPISRLTPGITDVDYRSPKGIAVYEAPTDARGHWEFTLDNGATWRDLGVPDIEHARLLPHDANARLRFVPAENFNGYVRIRYRAWDQSQGQPGGIADVSSSKVGGSKPFSTSVEGAVLLVSSVNDAPILANIGGSIGYRNNGAAIPIATEPGATSATGTVSDLDQGDFNGGRLRVWVSSGGDSSDRLEIAGAIFTLRGNEVIRDNQVIGTLNADAGVGLTPLEVRFNDKATPGIVQQLVRALRFRTQAGTSIQPRFVSLLLDDGDGGVCSLRKRINVSN